MQATSRLAFILLLAGCAGCVSSRDYFVDRGRDARDIVTATVGVGAGAKVRVGPLHAGLLLNTDCYGLRNGLLVDGSWWHDNSGVEEDWFLIPRSSGRSDCPVIWGWEGYFVRASVPPVPMRPGYNPGYHRFACAVSYIPFVAIPQSEEEFDGAVPHERLEEDERLSWSLRLKYLTQIEVVAGLVGTVRLGFSAGELVDFILGWTTLDIFHDDFGSGKRAGGSAPAAVPSGK